MMQPASIHTLAFVFLIISNFFHSFCKIESLAGNLDSKTTENSETHESAKMSILPGEGNDITNEKGKTVVNESSFKVLLEEKSVEIKQGDLGKTKEVNDESQKEMDGKPVDDEKDVNVDKKKAEDEVKEKVEEKLEETGIDLKVLNDYDFEHLTQAATGATTGDWLVLFTKKNNCDECTRAEKEMKIVYERVKHKLNVAKVVQDRSSKMTFKRFDIEKNLPIISLFHHGKRFSYQSNLSVDEFMKFLEEGYQLAPWSPVRAPYTSYEYYADESLEELKEMIFYKKNVSLIIFFAGFICGISVTSLCGSILFHLLENFKDDEEQCLREQEASHDMATAKNKTE